MDRQSIDDKKNNNTPVNSPRDIERRPMSPDEITFNQMMVDRSNANSPFPQIRGITPRMDTIARDNANHVRTNVYNICGDELDRRFFQSIIRLIIALFVLTYSAIQLSSDCEKDNNVYLVLISSILGFYLNSINLSDSIKK
jgi:hypothetical protein